MDSLPNDVILKIFSYFTTHELYRGPFNVCRRWRSIIEIRCLRIDSKRDLECFSEGSHYLQVLEVSTHIDFLGMFLDGLGSLHGRLKALKLYRCNPVNYKNVDKIAKYFPKLEHIDIFLTCNYVEPFFIKKMKKMKCLVLNNHIADSTLDTITQNCTKLKELHMYGFSNFYPLSQLQQLLDSRCDLLTSLTLRCTEVNDKVCSSIAACGQLQELRLYHCWLMTLSGMLKIANIKNLVTLHMTGTKLVHKFEMQTFIALLEGKSIYDLNLSDTEIADEHMPLLSSVCPNIRVLELWRCKNLTPLGVLSISLTLPRLYILDLNCDIPWMTVKQMSDLTNIKYLRFRLSKKEKRPNKPFTFEVCDCYHSFTGKYFRGNGDGFSANLMYHSLLSRNLFTSNQLPDDDYIF